MYVKTKKNGVIFFVGKCYQSLGNHEEALQSFKETWNSSEFNPILFREIGTTCLKLNRFDEGLQYAQKEVSEFPGDVGALANLAMFLIMLKRIDEAYDVIKRARKSNCNDLFVEKLDKFLNDVKSGSKSVPDEYDPIIMFKNS